MSQTITHEDSHVTISPYEVNSWAAAKEYYTSGGCANLAHAIADLLNLSMGILFSDNESLYNHTSGHAFVVLPNGDFLDIQGIHTKREMDEIWRGQVSWNIPNRISFLTLTPTQSLEIKNDYSDGLESHPEAMDYWWANKVINEYLNTEKGE